MNKKILTVTINPCIDKTIVLDGFNYGGLNCPVSMRDDVGGKGINVSKVLSTFDVSVATYALIAGDNGRIVRDYVSRIPTEPLFTECAGETRVNIKIRDSKTGITTEINDRSFCVGDDVSAQITRTIAEQLDDCSVMVLAGSLPKGIDDDFYASLIQLATERGVRVILDADMQKLKKAIAAKPYAIKPNLHEFGELNGREYTDTKDIITDAKKLLRGGISLVVVSLGADGAIYLTEDEVVLARPFAIDCKSTVGAGDSMVAAMAYSMCAGLDLCEMAALGVAAGSLTSSKEGTQVCTCDEIMSRRNDVIIEKL